MNITFRAQFVQPIGKLNPSDWRIPNPAPITVELFHVNGPRRSRWLLRALPCLTPFREFEPVEHHGTAKDRVLELFEKRISDWQMFSDGQPANPDTVEERPDGRFYKKELTHLAALNRSSPKGVNYYWTECGITAHVINVRSRRGHTSPTCQRCKEGWQRIKAQAKTKATHK